MNTIKRLAKVGEYQYMERLFKFGELYFRPLSDFIKMEETYGIGDKYENMASYCSPTNPILKMKFPDGNEFSLPPSSRINYGEHSQTNYIIYSMTVIDFYKDKESFRISNPENLERIGSNYDSIVIISNYNEFINRIKIAVQIQFEEIQYGPVEYYKEIDILKNDLTPFHKRNSYSPQKEYRFCISNFETPMTFEIGNIEDIATLIQLQPTVTV
ncbi:MAG: hypothetical protein PHY27_04850 [Parabacteroides sp.]|nr:hypothetical protein [Parabacteroides sp.]